MSYQEKKTIVTIFTGILLLAAYGAYAYNKVASGVAAADNLKFWAATMLVFVGIGIIASIIIQIIFHILISIALAVKSQVQNGQCDDQEIEKTLELEMVEDEMDKLIGLKSMRFGFAIAGIGFMLSLVSLVMNYAPAVMLNIIFISFNFGAILEGITQLFYYRRGITNA